MSSFILSLLGLMMLFEKIQMPRNLIGVCLSCTFIVLSFIWISGEDDGFMEISLVLEGLDLILFNEKKEVEIFKSV